MALQKKGQNEIAVKSVITGLCTCLSRHDGKLSKFLYIKSFLQSTDMVLLHDPGVYQVFNNKRAKNVVSWRSSPTMNLFATIPVVAFQTDLLMRYYGKHSFLRVGVDFLALCPAYAKKYCFWQFSAGERVKIEQCFSQIFFRRCCQRISFYIYHHHV